MIEPEIFDQKHARALAARLFWWKNPEEALANHERFLAQVLSLGTWNDIEEARRLWPAVDFRDALREAPAGVVDPRSWTYWHHILGLLPVPSLPTRSSRHANARPRHPASFAIILLERREGHP